jgi:quercetin dioxygenase-like cupin family protein
MSANQVKVIRDADQEWNSPPDSWEGKAKSGEPTAYYKALTPFEPGRPNVQRSRYEPHHFEPPHSHPEDELLVVVSGNLLFGDQKLGSGDSIFVPKNARYSLRTDDAGVEFVRVGFGPEN